MSKEAESAPDLPDFNLNFGNSAIMARRRPGLAAQRRHFRESPVEETVIGPASNTSESNVYKFKNPLLELAIYNVGHSALERYNLTQAEANFWSKVFTNGKWPTTIKVPKNVQIPEHAQNLAEVEAWLVRVKGFDIPAAQKKETGSRASKPKKRKKSRQKTR